MNRRGFLAGCLAAATAPAFVKSGLMQLYVPKSIDGIHIVSNSIEFVVPFASGENSMSAYELYKHLKKEWRDDQTLIKHQFPMEAVSKELMIFHEGYALAPQSVESISSGSIWMSSGFLRSS